MKRPPGLSGRCISATKRTKGPLPSNSTNNDGVVTSIDSRTPSPGHFEKTCSESDSDDDDSSDDDFEDWTSQNLYVGTGRIEVGHMIDSTSVLSDMNILRKRMAKEGAPSTEPAHDLIQTNMT